MARHFFLVALALLLASGFVGVVFADPLPWDSLWEGKPIQYVSIVVAELCGLFVGTVILTHNHQSSWPKATIIVSISLIISYAIGLTIWTLGYMAGILVYSPMNPFFNTSPHPLALIVLLLPESIGTFIGIIIIRTKQKATWKTATITMASAMLTSFLVGILIVNIYLRSL